jgi:DNA-binding MarR family transcriptional regulator
MPNTIASPVETADRLRLAIVRTARRLRQEAGEHLSPSSAAALATIERRGPLAPSELAELERVKRPTITRVLARLEEAGLVERTNDPADGRAFLVSITRQGSELLRRIRTRKTAYLARRLGKLDPDDLGALERAADVLERILEDERR